MCVSADRSDPCSVNMISADLNTSLNLPPSGCSISLIGFMGDGV